MVTSPRNAGMSGLAVLAAPALMAAFFIMSLSSSALAAPKTIGVILIGDIPYYQNMHKAFTEGMKGNGDIKYVVQSPAPEPMSWTNAARKLVVIGSDMIVAYGAPATLTAMKETSSIPILFAGVYDPDAMQIAGKNATGVSSKIPMADLLKGLGSIKKFSKLGVIFNKAEKDTILQVKEIKALEGKMGFKMSLFNSGQKDYASKINGIDALVLTTSCSAMCGIEDVIAVARQQRLPTAASLSGSKGIMYTISADPEEQGQALAKAASKVLGGSAPASIKFIKATRLQRVVNLKEASAAGFKVPQSLTASATEVIK